MDHIFVCNVPLKYTHCKLYRYMCNNSRTGHVFTVLKNVGFTVLIMAPKLRLNFVLSGWF